jgi:hypothetical protein
MFILFPYFPRRIIEFDFMYFTVKNNQKVNTTLFSCRCLSLGENDSRYSRCMYKVTAKIRPILWHYIYK